MSAGYQSMHPYQLYTSEPISKTPVREHYSPETSSSQRRPEKEPSSNLWIDLFWRTVHVMACAYNPSDDMMLMSMACFYEALSKLVPSGAVRKTMKEFMA